MDNIVPHVQSNEEPELQELVTMRRAFHQFPELGFTEFWTTSKICDVLDHLGYELTVGKDLYDEESQQQLLLDAETRKHAYDQAKARLSDERWLEQMKDGFTGVVAHIQGAKDGPTLGFRFDIDGLHVQESTDNSHFPCKEGFASLNSHMHACGHDGHITIGLGLAKRIKDHIRSLGGEYYLIFQPAEEGTSLPTSGGKIFSHLEFIQRLDYIIPVHLGMVNTRKIVCGVSFLSQKKFSVVFEGESIHASAYPERGKNALLAACCAVNNLYTIPRHGAGMSRINVGKFFADNPTNIISDHAHFDMELRGETNEIVEYLVEKAHHIIRGAALMHDVREHIEEKGEWITVKNSPKMIELLKHAMLTSGIPEDAIIDEYLAPGSEDATFLMREVHNHGGQATYLCLGSPTYGGHHHAQFDFDEDLLLWGVKILWEFIQTVTKENSNSSGTTTN